MFRSCSQVTAEMDATLACCSNQRGGAGDQRTDPGHESGGSDWGERGVDISAPCPGWVAESRLMDGSETMFMSQLCPRPAVFPSSRKHPSPSSRPPSVPAMCSLTRDG